MKINIYVFFLLLVFAFKLDYFTQMGLWAQDCANLKDGEEIRLDRQQMPLVNSKIQDQDGLGTCYANTSAVMLQSVIDGHPNVSYMQMMLNYAQNVNRNNDGAGFGLGKDGKLLTDTGEICKMIDLAKKSGGVCRLEDVVYENLSNSFDTHNGKKRLINALSQYYENVSKQFNVSSAFNPEKTEKAKENYRSELKNLLNSNMNMFMKKNCNEFDMTNAQNVVHALAALIETEKQDWNGNEELEKKLMPFRVAPLSYYSVKKTINGVETFQFSLKPEVLNLLNNDYAEKLKSIAVPPSAKVVFAEALAKHTEYGGLNRDKVLDLLNFIDPAVVQKLEEDYQRYTMRDPRVCQNNQLDYLSKNHEFMNDFKQNSCLNQYSHLGENIADAAKELLGITGIDLSKLNDFILNSMNLNYDEALGQLLTPNCTEDKKVKIPTGLDCRYHEIEFSREQKQNPSLFLKKKDYEKKILAEEIKRSMQQGKAASFTLCTIFFKDNPHYSHNALRAYAGKSDKNDCSLGPQDRFNGIHSVAVIGQRCNKGTIDYLVQNSWGEWGDLAEKYERDQVKGRAWFNESDIIDNVTSYNLLK